MIDLLVLIPSLVLDLRYATPRNLAGRPLYGAARAYLREPAARKLAKAAELLRTKGRRLIVYDAYRPLSAQRALWEAAPDKRYVADPAKGSMHNRGAVVDVALADLSGAPLPAPCPFDEFSPRARHSPATRALREAMEAAGFRALESEWWHYSDPDGSAWPLLDTPVESVIPAR